MLVVIIVGALFRAKSKTSVGKPPPDKSTSNQQKTETSSLAPKTVAYGLLALLIVTSGVIAFYSWSDANQLVKLRVFNANGDLSEYQAYRKNIKGRTFTSIEGVRIQLADTDRLEMLVLP